MRISREETAAPFAEHLALRMKKRHDGAAKGTGGCVERLADAFFRRVEARNPDGRENPRGAPLLEREIHERREGNPPHSKGYKVRLTRGFCKSERAIHVEKMYFYCIFGEKCVPDSTTKHTVFYYKNTVFYYDCRDFRFVSVNYIVIVQGRGKSLADARRAAR